MISMTGDDGMILLNRNIGPGKLKRCIIPRAVSSNAMMRVRKLTTRQAAASSVSHEDCKFGSSKMTDTTEDIL
jgi:hypothetical protein